MAAVNISLPVKLRSQAQELVQAGYYTSFSDLVRTAVRDLISESKYDVWAREAKKNPGSTLKNEGDITNYLEKIT